MVKSGGLIFEINRLLFEHAKKISEIWTYKWSFDIQNLLERDSLDCDFLDVLSELQTAIIFKRGKLMRFELPYCKNFSEVIEEKFNSFFNDLERLNANLLHLYNSNKKDKRLKSIRPFLGSLNKLLIRAKEELALDELRKRVVLFAKRKGIPIVFTKNKNFKEIMPFGSIVHGLTKPIEYYQEKYGPKEWTGCIAIKVYYNSLIEILTRGFSFIQEMALGALNFNISKGQWSSSMNYFYPFGFVFKQELNEILKSPVVPDEILNLVDVTNIGLSGGYGWTSAVSSVNDPEELQKLLDKHGFTDKYILGDKLFDERIFMALVNAKIFRNLKSMWHVDIEYGLRAYCFNEKKKLRAVPITTNLIDKIIVNGGSPWLTYIKSVETCYEKEVREELNILESLVD